MEKYNTKCALCGTPLYRANWQIKRNKTGRFYCDKKCHNEHRKSTEKSDLEDKIGINDLGEWLNKKYHDEELNAKDISELMYGVRTNSPNVATWMEKCGVGMRSRSEAVSLQWKDNSKRRKEQSRFAKEKFAEGTPARNKIKEAMKTEEYVFKCSLAKLGERNPMYGVKGSKHPQWNAELTEEEREIGRNYPGYARWRRLVYERDYFTCQKCKDNTGGNLVAHHINGYHWDKESRTEIDNGITLCTSCHKDFHKIYGYKNNNLFQLSQYMN